MKNLLNFFRKMLACDFTGKSRTKSFGKHPNAGSQKTAVPILLIVYNRPDVMEKVLSRLREIKPPVLYVACDGPDLRKEGDRERVSRVRSLVLEDADWGCRLRTLFNREHLGCRHGVSGALNWFFSNEEKGIILEDDCLPGKSFFPFCEVLLARYEKEPRVMAITGDNFQAGNIRGEHSYYFSKIPHCWGWASWRRAWAHYAPAVEHFYSLFSASEGTILSGNKTADERFKNYFLKTIRGEIDTWDYLWVWTVWVNQGVVIAPNRNLVQNIGIGHPDSTHTVIFNKHMAVDINEMEMPLSHPPRMAVDTEADRFAYRHHFGFSLEKEPVT